MINDIEELKTILQQQTILNKEFLTLEDLTSYLGLSKSSIYKLTCKREIPFYSPGGKKLYFKRAEIDQWIFKSRVSPVMEESLEIENYLSRINKI